MSPQLFLGFALLLPACSGSKAADDGDSGALIEGDSADVDGDGFALPDDCDDSNGQVHPDAVEVCDGVDNDCDAVIDEDVLLAYFTDSDGDGFGDPSGLVEACERPAGTVTTDTDCDDSRSDVFPGALEVCDDTDNDCDGVVDDDLTASWYVDGDGDGFGDLSTATSTCEPSSGMVTDGSDCDDGNSDVNPAAVEACNGLDDDCDGATDEAGAEGETDWYLDIDGDGYGDPTLSWQACDAPGWTVADSTDCDDSDSDVHPGADEWCNSIDDDCDGDTDEAGAFDEATWYADADGDGYGDPDTTSLACVAPSGTVAGDTDCDDNDAAINPAASEVCDEVDNDCDGDVDDGVTILWHTDSDGDGYGDPSDTALACEAPSGMVFDWTDCDDSDAAIHPAATEVECDGIDDDCDGSDLSGSSCANDFLTFNSTARLTISGTEAEHLVSDFTLQAWVRIASTATNKGQVLIGKHKCGYFNGWWLGLENNKPAIYTGGTWKTASDALNDDTWHHLAGTFDGSTAVIYVDGAAVLSKGMSKGTTNTSPWYVGDCTSGGFGPAADIDDVAIWSVARTAAEVAADALAPPTGTETDLVLYLPFDEASGQETADLSSAGWTGTLGTSTAVEASDPTWDAE
jgi:Concanavalin A-like lectin/glucanases superfamily/Putative metal-binding motif